MLEIIIHRHRDYFTIKEQEKSARCTDFELLRDYVYGTAKQQDAAIEVFNLFIENAE